jgi:hypothetical protein
MALQRPDLFPIRSLHPAGSHRIACKLLEGATVDFRNRKLSVARPSCAERPFCPQGVIVT